MPAVSKRAGVVSHQHAAWPRAARGSGRQLAVRSLPAIAMGRKQQQRSGGIIRAMVREDANEAYVIGLRLNPDRAGPEWFALWSEEPDGSSRMATRDGRVQWASTPERAHGLRRADQRLIGETEVDGVCDVALVLHRLASSETGDEGDVLDALNLLDDAVNTTGLGRRKASVCWTAWLWRSPKANRWITLSLPSAPRRRLKR